MQTYAVRAHNTATDSNNKIHDDAVARRYGFAGGLVPGVDVYAYMTRPAAEAWGSTWLARGTMSARFAKPVYEDDDVVVEPGPVRTIAGAEEVELALRNPAGDVCATGRATLPAQPAPAPAASQWPRMALPERRHAAEPNVVANLGDLGAWERHYHAERAADYLAGIRDDLELYEDGRVAHPAWLVRTANWVLADNVALGPWIHVESTTAHHRLVTDGALVSTRARVAAEYERKGHRFVELDIAVVIDDEHVATTIRHVAIYRPRPIAP